MVGLSKTPTAPSGRVIKLISASSRDLRTFTIVLALVSARSFNTAVSDKRALSVDLRSNDSHDVLLKQTLCKNIGKDIK